MKYPIPIIDIFAGPGGLGEGFSAFADEKTGKKAFRIALSIEMDEFAHQTLTLRSFYRQFNMEKPVPDDYYSFLRQDITLQELYKRHPREYANACKEAWRARLGNNENSEPHELVDKRIKEALKGQKDFLLIGGPPCQAYSLVGRSRKKLAILDEANDEKVGLYKEYLRILAVHNPAVFVMENVKGMLSAKTEESPIFEKILKDLSNPVEAYHVLFKQNGLKLECPGYHIYSFIKKGELRHTDFLIRSEEYGIPQARHRVILLGIRKDIDVQPGLLIPSNAVSVSDVISDLPKIRSSLSKSIDSKDNWKMVIKGILDINILRDIDKDVVKEIREQLKILTSGNPKTGGVFIHEKTKGPAFEPEWYTDERLNGVCNHESRGHMDSDLLRYFFASCYANVKGRSPKLEDFPEALLPAHKNVKSGIEDRKFADRFRVQLYEQYAKTITSHISKDGHYYIHPDPVQCRSLTVREAARIQTFPDDYFFCGPRTSQFVQVGNAVPPLLAFRLALIVKDVFIKLL